MTKKFIILILTALLSFTVTIVAVTFGGVATATTCAPNDLSCDVTIANMPYTRDDTPPPGPVTNGYNAGTAICSTNDSLCGGSSRTYITNFGDKVQTPPQLVSANGLYRLYVHGVTCKATLERISTGQVLWQNTGTEAGDYGCPPRGADGKQSWADLVAYNDGNMVLNLFYRNSDGTLVSNRKWSSQTSSCRAANYGGDGVLMNEGFFAYWTDTDNPVTGRVQNWNSNRNGNRPTTLDCK